MSVQTSLLLDRRLFPSFTELPMSDELDCLYWQEQQNGMLQPNRTWTFYGEIIDDTLSQLPRLGNRVEVQDVTGEVHSVLFFPPNRPRFPWGELRKGHTVFIRYAQRVFFSDLCSEAVKVEDMRFVKVVRANLDAILHTTQLYWDHQAHCKHCGVGIAHLGGVAARCPSCAIATYCSPACVQHGMPAHASYCMLCAQLGQVFNIDAERFIDYIPFKNDF